MDATATPARDFMVMIDSQAANVDTEYAQLDAHDETLYDKIHAEAGDTREKAARGTGPWKMSADEALARATPETLAAYDRNRDAMRANRTRAAALHAVWQSHGRWSRFFLVTSSDGGHIHANTTCSARLTTAYAWLPELAGLTEGDAVAAHGPNLCTRCFPTAPVEWTRGGLPENACTGSKRRPDGPTRRVGMRTIGTCTECQESQLVNLDGTVRQHDRKLTEAEQAAKKALSKARSTVSRLENDESYWARIVERRPVEIEAVENDLREAITVGNLSWAASAWHRLERAQGDLATATRKLSGIRTRLGVARKALSELEQSA